MPRVFISYRRADSQAITGRIYDRLVTAFGTDNIFKDVDRIPPGSTFAEVLEAELHKCNVLLVIIGSSWADIRNEAGQKRLEDPQDFVRVEIEKGLQRGDMLVVPVLVDNAPVPDAGELPASLEKLVSLQVVQVRHDPDFHRDMNRLIDFLEILQQQEERVQVRERGLARRNLRRILAGLGLLAAVIVIGVMIAIARGIIHIFPTPVPTLDEREVAMQIVMTFTAEAIAAQATPTPNATATIEAIMTGFVTETSAARVTPATSTRTPSITPIPSDTPADTETPSLTDIPTTTEDFSASEDVQTVILAGEATRTQAALDAQAALDVTSSTPESTVSPTALPSDTAVPTSTPTNTASPAPTLPPTQRPTVSNTPTATENFAATASAEAAAVTQAAIDARATFIIRQTQTQMAVEAYTDTPTVTHTPRPTRTARPPTVTPTGVPQSAVLLEEDFEDGLAQGFGVIQGNWRVVTEPNGNQAYEGSGQPGVWAAVRLGEARWSNYVLELRVKPIGFEPIPPGRSVTEDDVLKGSAEVFVYGQNYDCVGCSNYTVGLSFAEANILVARKDSLANWVEPLPVNNPMRYNYDDWNIVRIEVYDSIIRTWVNEVQVLPMFDERYFGGYAGLVVFPLSTVLFDDIRIWSLN